ncbi:hypothetical protein EA658_20365 [Pseudoxanthomonas winnipegensis]|uniref:Uncharacterized protein n=1 Tax=Pseudoxanthomonas winnipegensis TaxID=2480810 RepID=A0ABY1W8Y7_9GAMM|nr:hypothetical protein [Pseudoxanthomonas winnipegensis]TAA08225.1 hypothetical protein EA659_16215 [Pseudoxanthomonas winnipegensis]TAA16241.1 hypothetical protein EA658_20365 [Pseudoxanthomonas winnipegensis]TAH72686.1 hypothetical protein EA657_10640 [Pseudoxanthomonas winnipegensis]
MTDPLNILGPEHGKWSGWPAGALALYTLVTDEQWRIWHAAGTPKPTPERLLKDIDAVMHAAMASELAATLEAADPHVLGDLQQELRAHQHFAGMLSADDLIPSL